MQTVKLVPNLDEKAVLLREILASHPGLIVAYSGGVDSAFLAWAAHQALGDRMRAVIADSASLARTHLEDALAFAREQQIPVEVVETRELENPAYARNDAMRCFHCKDELFTVLEEFRSAHGFAAVAYGVNADDEGDFRPGQQAARQHHVLAPLLDARLTKLEIRELAKQAGLRVWEKPASACLSSRIEYGREVTPQALKVIELGEDALRELGFRQFRVRHHGEIVRIEIARDELPRALTEEMAREFTAVFKQLGFKFVTIDMEGFRSGSMNQLLTAEDLVRGSSGRASTPRAQPTTKAS
ncbi:MAG: ATP-dependent sacrificial sulfur transferase LarE [Terriglobales bacterium]